MNNAQLFCYDDAIDWTEVKMRMGNDNELLTEILTLFLEDAPQHLVRIQSAIECENGVDLARSAHSLRGSAAVFGLKRLGQLLERLEALGREGHAWSAMALYGGVLDEMSRIAIALRNTLSMLGGTSASSDRVGHQLNVRTHLS